MTHLALPFFDAAHRDLAADLGAWADARVDEREPEDAGAACRVLVRSLGEAGWLRLCVPAPAGRDERLDVRSLCLARETLAYRSALADFAFAMQGLGSGPLSLFGNEAQRARYLPAVARGEMIAAFALSEAEAGSDVAALATTARADGDGFVLDGGKTWISNAGIADFYVVFARTGEVGSRGLSAFVVEADAPGLAVTAQIPTAAPHPLGTLAFDGCRVPKDNLIGTPGEGMKVALATLDVFRSTVGAAALGFARRALAETLRHVRRREVFGGPLAELPVVQQKLAEMATEVEASALMVYRAAWTKDAGAARVTKEAAMAKAYATEAAQRVIDAAVQLHGGLGVTTGSVVERLYRDVRPLRIYEGATEIQHLVIARQLLREEEGKSGRENDGPRTTDHGQPTNRMRFLQPPGWAAPKGYANGVLAEGRLLFVAGQIGWGAEQRLVSDDFAAQTEQALRNVAAVLAEGGAEPKHVVRLTWYVADKRAYLAAQRDVGRAYRSVFGNHYPPMTLVEVADLLEDGALVEIEATAVVEKGGEGE